MEQYLNFWYTWLGVAITIMAICSGCIAAVFSWYNLSIRKPKSKSQTLQEQTDEEDFEECSVEIMKDGWIKVDRDEFFGMANAQAAANNLESCMSKWIYEIDEAWWRMFHFRNRLTVLHEGLIAKDTLNPDMYEGFKRAITASSIAYDFAIPIGLFVMDRAVILNALKYKVMTEPLRVDLKEIEFNGYVQINSLKNLIYGLMRYSAVTTAFNNDIIPNASYLYGVLKNNPTTLKASLAVNTMLENPGGLMQFKKAMTCVYLCNGLPVPRDYMYLDVEVMDYVDKSDKYELSKGPIKHLEKKPT